MNKYKCTVCSYKYDPKKGDPTKDIPPGTSFEELPDNWKCPTCNQPIMAFVEMK